MIALTQENSSVNRQATPVGEVLDLQHLLQENHTLRWDRNFYKSLLERATARETLLKQEIQQLNARIRYLEKRLYGRKSEKKTSKFKSNLSTASSSDDEPKRSRGHQRVVPAMDAGITATFRLKRISLHWMKQSVPTADVPIRRIRFLALKIRKIRNLSKSRCVRTAGSAKKVQKSCQCQEIPGIITAPGPGKLIDKGKLGISVWVTVLLEKYLYQRPINRLLESFKDIEFDMAAETIGDGLKKLALLLEPVLQQIIQKNQTERDLHADETRWQVFEFIC